MRAADPSSERRAPARTRAEWWIVALAALLWLPAIGARDLWSPDEPRIAEVAEELRAAISQTGPSAALVLELNGEPYSQKPPLYYWTAAALGAPFGRVAPWAARLPSALAAIAGLALTMALTRRLFPEVGARAAPLAGALLALSFRWGELAQRASLDVVLSALELGALLAWLRFVRGEWTRERAWRCVHALLGLAMLVKGPVALLPLPVIALATAWSRRRSGAPSLALPESSGLFAARHLAISLGPFLVWGAFVLASTPAGFFEDAVLDNLIGRFFSGTSHARPFYYYALQLPADFLPVSLFLPAAVWLGRASLRAADRDAAAWRALAAWSLIFLVFFSLSAGKRGTYLLPLFPALSVASAVAALRLLERRARLPLHAGLLACLGAASLGALALALLGGSFEFPSGLAERLGFEDGYEVPRNFAAACAAIGASATFVGACAIARGWNAERRLWAIAASLAALQLSVSLLLYPSLDVGRSLRAVAEAADALARPGEPIGVVRHPSIRPALAYYSSGPPGRFVDLLTRSEVDAFLAPPGRVLIVEPGRHGAADALPELRGPVLARFRGGDRTIWVMGKSEAADTRAGEPHRQAPETPTLR